MSKALTWQTPLIPTFQTTGMSLDLHKVLQLEEALTPKSFQAAVKYLKLF